MENEKLKYFTTNRKPRTTITILLLVFFACGLCAQSDEHADAPYWRQAIGGAVVGNPVAQVESVVILTDGGNLKSFSSQGTHLWDFYARGRLTPYVGRSREGTSYICRTNGLLIAVNRAGRELWRLNLGAALVSPVLAGWDGRIFVFTDKKITCLTAAGYTLWSKALESRSVINPILDIKGGIIIVLEDGRVQRFDPFGNVFSYSSNNYRAVPAAAASLNIEGWGHCVLLLYENRGLELVYPSLGYGESLGDGASLKGKLELPAAPLAVIGREHEAAALLRDGKVILFSPEQRKILWTGASHIRPEELREISERPQERVRLIFDERGIYVLTKQGGTGFAADGRRLWFTRISNTAAVADFGDDGIIYSGGNDWILYAYRLEERVRANQRLLYGEASDGSYGTGNPGTSSHGDHFYWYNETLIRANLAEIREAIRKGSVGAMEKEYLALLMGLASANSGNGAVQSIYRIEAAQLLAFLGSREIIPFLTHVFSHDPDNLVKAAAVESIGKIGVDPEGIAMRAFENAVYPPSPIRDEQVMTKIAAAIGALCRFSGPPLSEAGIRLLVRLSGSGIPSSVQRQAQREIRNL